MSLDLKDFRVSDDTQINAPPPLRRPSQSITRSIRTESPYADDLTQGFLNCVDPQEMTTLAEEQLTTNSIVALLALHALNHTGNTTGNWQAPGVGSDVFRYLATKHLFEATSQEDDWTVQSVSEEEEQRDEEAAKRLLTLIGRLADWQACDSSDPSFSSTL
ncbi:MAG: hypothetical protein KDK78_10585 [Chlamydiia bacterium]|nr:hypothetical protein [Chlamydiia bacterium]